MSFKQSNETIIDFRSDTVSLPTDAMRTAMAIAEVGDDVFGEDPTVIELERKCAELFEKEAALFVTSGTMGNLISIMTHCRERDSEVIVGSMSHVFLYEQGHSMVNLFTNSMMIIITLFDHSSWRIDCGRCIIERNPE